MRLTFATLVACSLASGCGSLPMGKQEKKPSNEAPANGGEGNAEPTPDDPDRDEALLQELETEPVAACHASGYLFERRKLACSPDVLLATSFTCDRAGIRLAFEETGFQIDVVLDAALGKEGFADDQGDGFSLDQCGETQDGRRLVHFVKRGDDGKVVVREIETHL